MESLLIKNQRFKIISLNMDKLYTALRTSITNSHTPVLLNRSLYSLGIGHSERPVYNGSPCPGDNQYCYRQGIKRISKQQKLDDIINRLFLKDCTSDLFASCLTHQLTTFIRWKSNPNALHSDILSVNWKHLTG